MIGFKFSGRATAFAAASVFALGLVAATPQEAQAGKTGSFLLGAAAGAAGLAALSHITKPRRRYYEPRPVRRYYAPAPRRTYYRGLTDWDRYCLSKYRSYKPSTGTYTSYSGYERPCR